MFIFYEMYRKQKLWKKLKKRYRIYYPKVAIVLSGESRTLDKACITHLPLYIKRKYASGAVVFYPEDSYKETDFDLGTIYEVSYVPLKKEMINDLYSFYCFMKFYDNIVFTYTDTPDDNMLKRYLEETDITENDAVCLALYHLRYVASSPQ